MRLCGIRKSLWNWVSLKRICMWWCRVDGLTLLRRRENCCCCCCRRRRRRCCCCCCYCCCCCCSWDVLQPQEVWIPTLSYQEVQNMSQVHYKHNLNHSRRRVTLTETSLRNIRVTHTNAKEQRWSHTRKRKQVDESQLSITFLAHSLCYFSYILNSWLISRKEQEIQVFKCSFHVLQSTNCKFFPYFSDRSTIYLNESRLSFFHHMFRS